VVLPIHSKSYANHQYSFAGVCSLGSGLELDGGWEAEVTLEGELESARWLLHWPGLLAMTLGKKVTRRGKDQIDDSLRRTIIIHLRRLGRYRLSDDREFD